MRAESPRGAFNLRGDRFDNFQRERDFKPITKVEGHRNVNRFKPRFYQAPIIKALDSGYKRVVAIMPRRAGKDVTALNYVIREMYRTGGIYFYIFPTFTQAKRVIWSGQTNTGQKFLDFFPAELVIRSNSQDLSISMINSKGKESLFQLIGSEQFNRLMGTNPRGLVFSEMALQDPRAFQYLQPIITANKGWALFISTPRGKNHFWHLSQIAKKSPDWFFYHLTVEDTKHIDLDDIEKEKADGIMSEDLVQQEYYCSFQLGVEGCYYGKYLERARREERIGEVPWDQSAKVHTAWDLGMSDSTAIIFFQSTRGGQVRIIDCYENSKKGLEYYVEVLNQKPYTYGKHIAPHDIKVQEWGTSMTRLEKAQSLGVNFTVTKKLGLADGIEAARSIFSRVCIDEKKCIHLLHALENYRQVYDFKNKVYTPKPHHDWSSDFADAFRYMAISLRLTEMDEDQKERIQARYNKVRFGLDPRGFDFSQPNYYNGGMQPW